MVFPRLLLYEEFLSPFILLSFSFVNIILNIFFFSILRILVPELLLQLDFIVGKNAGVFLEIKIFSIVFLPKEKFLKGLSNFEFGMKAIFSSLFASFLLFLFG